MAKSTNIRAYPNKLHPNKNKSVLLEALCRVYTTEYGVHTSRLWRDFQLGKFTRFSNFGSTKDLSTALSQGYLQGCLAVICGNLNSYTQAVHRRFRQVVARSSLAKDGVLAHKLYAINKACAWYQKSFEYCSEIREVVDENGVVSKVYVKTPVEPEVLKLARRILKNVMCTKVHFPRTKNPTLMLDSRTAVLSESKEATEFTHWLGISVPGQNKRVQVPFDMSDYCAQSKGEFANSMQLRLTPSHDFIATLFRKPSLDELREQFTAKFVCRAERNNKSNATSVALDFGLATLLATTENACYGKYWLEKLTHYNKLLVDIQSKRQRLKISVRCKRYDALVQRIRGFIKTEIGRILNMWMQQHPNLKTVVIEDLCFTFPNLSRRLNRIIQNCGLARLKQKLKEFALVYDFEVIEVNPAYTSQLCRCCGHVSKSNRKTQKDFKCTICGHTAHADLQAAQSIGERFTNKQLAKLTTKNAILTYLGLEFAKNLEGNIRNGLVDLRKLCTWLRKPANLRKIPEVVRVQLAVLLRNFKRSRTLATELEFFDRGSRTNIGLDKHFAVQHAYGINTL